MNQNSNSYDVVIIGAGISGLAAAQELSPSKQIILLEARDRIGGRVWTDRTWGTALDLGASWIHGSKRNPIATLANKFGIKVVTTNTDNLSLKRYDYLSLYDWNGKKLTESEIIRLKRLLEDLEIFIKNAQDTSDRDVSYQSIVKKFISFHQFNERELRIFKYAVRAAIDYEYAEDASKLSLLEFGKDEPYSGSDLLFLDGYDQIIMQLAKDLPIALNQEVQKINYDAEHVEIITKTDTFYAKAAVVTLPLGVLKANPDLFSPALPKPKQKAILRMQMGLLNKVYLRFLSPFWDVDSEVIGYIPTAKLSWIEFINYYKYSRQPILVGFNAGSRAREMEQWPEEKIVDSIMQALRIIYGDRVQNPSAAIVTRWGTDPYAHGSYSYIPVGVPGNMCGTLAEPVLKRLFFAGEATHDKTLSTVHGAYLSGIKAAKLINSIFK